MRVRVCVRYQCHYLNSAALGVSDWNLGGVAWPENEYDIVIKIVYDEDGNYVSYEKLDQQFDDTKSGGTDEFLVRMSREENKHACADT